MTVTTAPDARATGSLRSALTPGSRAARTIALGVGAFVALLVVTQFAFPGRGAGARGTPTAILFTGLVIGSVNALTAAGIVLVYRTTRIINFAQTAIGAAGAALVFALMEFRSMPFVLAFPLGLALAAAVGLLFDLVFGRRFFKSPRLVLTVLTIVAGGFLGGVSTDLVRRLPIFPPVESQSLEQILGATDVRSKLPFPGFTFEVGELPLQFGFSELLAIEVSVLALLGLAFFFRSTRAGVAVRAMAENTDRASLLGISVGTMSSIAWMLAGVMSGASVTLTGVLTTPAAAGGFAPEVFLPALAAAVIGRMRSLSVTVASAIGISIATRSILWSFESDRPVIDLVLLVVVAGGLLAQRKSLLRGEQDATASWEASEEQRPIPKELLAVGGLRVVRRVLIGVGVVMAALYPFITSTAQTNLGAVIALDTITVLSIVVLTGWAGQVSLGQVGFAAVGAVVAGSLTSKAGVPFWFAVPLASAFTAGFAALVGIPALRIKGLFLAVTTLSFSIAVGSMLFSERYFGWLLPEDIERPTFFFIDFEDERSMYYLSVLALVATIVVITNLRRSRFGRVLIALRENEANLQSFGVRAVRTKLIAFAVSGALAGFGGAIFAHQQRGLSGESFQAFASINVFTMAVLGGVGSVSGALLGALYFNVTTYAITHPIIVGFIGGGGTLIILYTAPGGLISLVTKVRDAVLRIVAQRKQLVVPSLFADYDPDALARRLIPMAPPLNDGGLAALSTAERFRQASILHADGVTADGGRGAAERARESAAIGAAARHVQGLEGDEQEMVGS